METSNTTGLSWAVTVLVFVVGMMILHLPGVAKLDPIAPVDLIYNHAPWDVDKPDDVTVGSNVLSDQFDYVHPTYAYIVNNLRDGVIPGHTSLIGNGGPLFFNMTHYGSNPIALGLGVMFGAAQGYSLYLLLLASLAALCFFDLLRSYELHPIAALWGVMILVFSTTSLTALGIPMSDQMFFTVIIMWSLRRIFLNPNLLLFFPLTLTSYLLLTSAYPPGTITAGLFLIAYALMELTVAIRRGRFAMSQIWIGIFALFSILLLASPFLIEAANMFLSAEGLDLETRDDAYAGWRLAEGAAFLGFHPRVIGDAPGIVLSTWAPRWFFDMNYFGVATTAFLISAVFCIGRYRRISFFLIAMVVYLMTIYAYKDIYAQTLGQLPILSGVRAYAHIYMWVICIAALSAYGVQTQFSSKLGPRTRMLALSVGVIGMVGFAMYLSAITPDLQAVVNKAPNQSRNVIHWFPAGLLVATLGYYLLGQARKGTQKVSETVSAGSLILAALFVTSYDLLSVSSGVNRTVTKDNYFPTHPAVEQLQEMQGDAKIMPMSSGLIGLAHLPYDLRSIAFRGFFNARTRDVVREFSPTFPTQGLVSQFLYPPDSTDLTHPFIQLMGVKYFTDLTTSYHLDEYEKLLVPRNVKGRMELLPGEMLTQFLDVSESENIGRFEIRFPTFPEGGALKIRIEIESEERTLWSDQISFQDLQQTRHRDWVYSVVFDEEITLIDDRLVITLGEASHTTEIATYSQRTNSDILQLPNGRQIISSLAVDVFEKKTIDRERYPSLQKVRSQGISIYENLDYAGRVHITPNCIERPENEMLSEISAKRPDLTQSVFRETCPSKELNGGIARIVNEQPGRLGIAVDTEGATILVLGDNYTKGWRAYADGNPTTVFRASYNFIGVDVPAGTERIVLRYAPAGLWPAFWVACTVWILLILGFVYLAGLRIWLWVQKIRKTPISATRIRALK